MMKHLKQKLIALLCVTFAVVSAWANDSVVWHHPVVGYTHSIVEVTKVVARWTARKCRAMYITLQVIGFKSCARRNCKRMAGTFP